MSRSVTFNEIERGTERLRAYAILAKTANHFVAGYGFACLLPRRLDRLLKKTLAEEKIQSITPQQAEWLIVQLQSLFSAVQAIVCSREAERLLNIPLIGYPIRRLRIQTEDISDVIDDLVLFSHSGFKRLLSDYGLGIGLWRSKKTPTKS